MRFHKARLYRKSTAPQTASCRPRQHSQYLTAWLMKEFFGATHSVACAAPKNEPFHVFETPRGVEFGKARRTGSNVAYKYKAAAGPCKRNFVPLGVEGRSPRAFLLLRFLCVEQRKCSRVQRNRARSFMQYHTFRPHRSSNINLKKMLDFWASKW